MKTNKCDTWRVASGGTDAVGVGLSRHPSPVTRLSLAFTLVELLTVIAVIAVIAALLFPVAGAVRRQAAIHNAQAQMGQLETAIERYHSAYGFYPPSCPNGPLTNQLYYELVGTTNIAAPGGAPIYEPLGNPGRQLSALQVNRAFGVAGFMNCSKTGGDESTQPARNFLPGLNTNQVSTIQVAGPYINLLVTPLGGPDGSYNPLGTASLTHIGVNPWRYAYPGTNNPGSYDLWIQLQIAGNTNLICNWTKQVQINNHSVP